MLKSSFRTRTHFCYVGPADAPRGGDRLPGAGHGPGGLDPTAAQGRGPPGAAHVLPVPREDLIYRHVDWLVLRARGANKAFRLGVEDKFVTT